MLLQPDLQRRFLLLLGAGGELGSTSTIGVTPPCNAARAGSSSGHCSFCSIFCLRLWLIPFQRCKKWGFAASLCLLASVPWVIPPSFNFHVLGSTLIFFFFFFFLSSRISHPAQWGFVITSPPASLGRCFSSPAGRCALPSSRGESCLRVRAEGSAVGRNGVFSHKARREKAGTHTSVPACVSSVSEDLPSPPRVVAVERRHAKSCWL